MATLDTDRRDMRTNDNNLPAGYIAHTTRHSSEQRVYIHSWRIHGVDRHLGGLDRDRGDNRRDNEDEDKEDGLDWYRGDENKLLTYVGA